MRSATMPASGCVRPHQSWPKANARLMLASPRPVAVFTLPRNRPIDWRAPMVSAKLPPAASSTRAIGGRLRCGADPAVGSFIVGLRFIEELQTVIENRVQCRHLLRAEALVQRQLRLFPGPLAFGALGAAGLGGADQAAACVVARALLDPA